MWSRTARVRSAPFVPAEDQGPEYPHAHSFFDPPPSRALCPPLAQPAPGRGDDPGGPALREGGPGRRSSLRRGGGRPVPAQLPARRLDGIENLALGAGASAETAPDHRPLRQRHGRAQAGLRDLQHVLRRPQGGHGEGVQPAGRRVPRRLRHQLRQPSHGRVRRKHVYDPVLGRRPARAQAHRSQLHAGTLRGQVEPARGPGFDRQSLRRGIRRVEVLPGVHVGRLQRDPVRDLLQLAGRLRLSGDDLGGAREDRAGRSFLCHGRHLQRRPGRRPARSPRRGLQLPRAALRHRRDRLPSQPGLGRHRIARQSQARRLRPRWSHPAVRR